MCCYKCFLLLQFSIDCGKVIFFSLHLNRWKEVMRLCFNLPMWNHLEGGVKEVCLLTFPQSSSLSGICQESFSCSVERKVFFFHNWKAIIWLVVHCGIQWMHEAGFMNCCVVHPHSSPPPLTKKTGGPIRHRGALYVFVAVYVNGCMLTSCLRALLNAFLSGENEEGKGIHCLFHTDEPLPIEAPVKKV